MTIALGVSIFRQIYRHGPIHKMTGTCCKPKHVLLTIYLEILDALIRVKPVARSSILVNEFTYR